MFRFGDFEVDVAARELRHRGATVHLEPQAFDLLVSLIEQRDRVVPKAELLDGVWGHRFLSEASLTTRIKEVRRAVDDDGTQQHTVRNVRGRGYQFVAPVTEADASADGRVGDDGLVGRDDVVASATEALTRAPIVTLTGPGGVGKSALARLIASRADGRHPDGVHWVELAALDADTPVVPAVARAMDVELDGRRPDDALRSIARLEALVVLDNCEHVVDEVGTLVEGLLRVTEPGVRILATSRVALGISGETVVPVGPLAVEAASELFVTRARAASPAWDPAAVPTPDVVALVTGLDRLPLTIEMAAARSRSMSFDELATVIAAGTPLLQVTHRTPALRHRSLDSLVRSSAELLDDHDRKVFEGFSVFAGSVRVDDAAGVLAAEDPDGVIFDLASLAERSLLVADVRGSTTWYSMLATVRTVAARWTQESGRADGLQRRHAEHFLQVLRGIDDELRTPDEGDARRRLDAIVDELRVAHRWARTADPGLASGMSAALFHGSYPTLWHEPAAWSRALLADCADPDDPVTDGAIVVIAGEAAHTGDLRWAREQTDRVRRSADGRLRAMAAEVAADVALYEGDLDEARRAALELRRAGEELGDRHALAFGHVDDALARAYGGDTAGALAGLAAVDPAGFAPTDRAWLAYARGDALSLAGAPDAAAAFQEAIALGDEVGNRFVVSVSLTSLATEHARRGDRQPALAAYARALDDFVRHGNTTHAVTALRNLIALLADLGDDRGAVVIAGAVADEGLRVSYGAEAERIAGILVDVESRVGDQRFREWFDEGRHLEPDEATRTAARLIAVHRT